MKRSVTALFLALIFLMGLTSCTPKNYVGVDSSGLDPFVIGGIGPLTEGFSELGRSVQNGAQLAVDEINATGGVNGFRLVLNFQDSKGTEEGAKTVYEKLITNDMKVLLGGVLSEETIALADLAAEDGILMVTPTAAHSDALGKGGNGFRICLDYGRLGTAAANFIADKKAGARTLIVTDDGTWGTVQAVDPFLEICRKRNLAGDSLILSPNAEKAELRLALETLLGTSYDVIFLLLQETDAKNFLEIYALNHPTQIPTVLTVPSGKVSEAEDTKAPAASDGDAETYDKPLPESSVKESLLYREGSCILSSFFIEEDSATVQNFVASYTEAYGQPPDRYAADAYDGVYAIAEAIKKAGILPQNIEYSDMEEKLISAMTKIEVRGVTGTMSWTPDGETTRPASVRILKDGVYIPFVKVAE